MRRCEARTCRQRIQHKSHIQRLLRMDPEPRSDVKMFQNKTATSWNRFRFASGCYGSVCIWILVDLLLGKVGCGFSHVPCTWRVCQWCTGLRDPKKKKRAEKISSSPTDRGAAKTRARGGQSANAMGDPLHSQFSWQAQCKSADFVVLDGVGGEGAAPPPQSEPNVKTHHHKRNH